MIVSCDEMMSHKYHSLLKYIINVLKLYLLNVMEMRFYYCFKLTHIKSGD